jgi:hypothetical protein
MAVPPDTAFAAGVGNCLRQGANIRVVPTGLGTRRKALLLDERDLGLSFPRKRGLVRLTSRHVLPTDWAPRPELKRRGVVFEEVDLPGVRTEGRTVDVRSSS